jgi:hypothetical protein
VRLSILIEVFPIESFECMKLCYDAGPACSLAVPTRQPTTPQFVNPRLPIPLPPPQDVVAGSLLESKSSLSWSYILAVLYQTRIFFAPKMLHRASTGRLNLTHRLYIGVTRAAHISQISLARFRMPAYINNFAEYESHVMSDRTVKFLLEKRLIMQMGAD